MEERLTELYQGVAVHATTDREHMAALELLAVVMLADHHVGEDELDVLKELTEDWRGTAFSVDQYLGQAIATARNAWAHGTVNELLDSIDGRITSRVLRMALFSAGTRPRRDRRRRHAGGRHPALRDRRPLRLTAVSHPSVSLRPSVSCGASPHEALG